MAGGGPWRGVRNSRPAGLRSRGRGRNASENDCSGRTANVYPGRAVKRCGLRGPRLRPVAVGDRHESWRAPRPDAGGLRDGDAPDPPALVLHDERHPHHGQGVACPSPLFRLERGIRNPRPRIAQPVLLLAGHVRHDASARCDGPDHQRPPPAGPLPFRHGARGLLQLRAVQRAPLVHRRHGRQGDRAQLGRASRGGRDRLPEAVSGRRPRPLDPVVRGRRQPRPVLDGRRVSDGEGPAGAGRQQRARDLFTSRSGAFGAECIGRFRHVCGRGRWRHALRGRDPLGAHKRVCGAAAGRARSRAPRRQPVRDTRRKKLFLSRLLPALATPNEGSGRGVFATLPSAARPRLRAARRCDASGGQSRSAGDGAGGSGGGSGRVSQAGSGGSAEATAAG